MKDPPCSPPNSPSSSSGSEPLEPDGRGSDSYYELRPGSPRDSSASDISTYCLNGYQVSQTHLAPVSIRPARILICHLV